MNRKFSFSLLAGAAVFAVIVVVKIITDRFTIVRSGTLTRIARVL